MERNYFYAAKVAALGCASLILGGCSQDVDDEMVLYGSWLEESPAEERTEIYFYSHDRLVIDRSGEKQDQTYFIEGDSIYLEQNKDREEAAFYFRQINENSFQIGNIYPAIPENGATFMIFRRTASIPDDTSFE